MEMSGHESFVYAVKVLPGIGFVSCGEDGSVRIWNNGECVQTVRLPCISVWSVDVLPNGDFVCGGNDGYIRVFSAVESRWASPETLDLYEKSLANRSVNA